MAHECPECGYLCHCGGDIDDISFGESDSCICCINKLYGDDDEDYSEDDYEDFRDGTLQPMIPIEYKEQP